MPLFFFLSGFTVDLKNNCIWDFADVRFILRKRMKSLVIPAVSYCLLYSIINGHFTYEWFLPALFINVVVFLIMKLFSHTLHLNDWQEIILATFIFVSLYGAASYLGCEDLKWDIRFFVFFYCGYLIQKTNLLTKLSRYNIVYTISLIIFVVTFYCNFYIGLKMGLPLALCAIYILCSQCNYNGHWEVNPIARIICFLGKKTMWIYVLHALFVPKSLFLGSIITYQFVNDQSIQMSLLIQLLLGVSISIYVCGISCIVACVISQSKILNLFMFGKTLK